MRRHILVAVLTLTLISLSSNLVNIPPQPTVQASKETKPSEALKQPTKPKTIKHAPKKQTPVRQAQKQPVVVHKSVPKPVAVPSSGSVSSIITTAAKRHGIDPARALRIATCESGLNVRAINTGYYAGGGHPTGLFQYLPETWNRIGSRSPYGVGDIYSAQDQANVTMWAWANGYAGEWECQ